MKEDSAYKAALEAYTRYYVANTPKIFCRKRKKKNQFIDSTSQDVL